MSLRAYQSKRRFSQTPEPKGSIQQISGPLRFVVQKHQATRLHYDFRLELAGTLKSWAVPKGPSLNPQEKRLAMMVEDHPLEYAGFEGIIPKGNYGAGTVMVWDEGTYQVPGIAGRAQNEELLLAGLDKGRLSLFLEGKKLRGKFALFKFPRGGQNAWLLVKKQDAHARDKIIDEDRSVLSHRTLAEIATPEIIASDVSAAPRAAMPRNLKPMLASPVDQAFDNPDWLFEIKWDGYRAIAEVNQKKVRLYSRSKLSLADRFPSIIASLKRLGHEAVLDGEIVVLDSAGKSQFQLLQNYPRSGKGALVYYVFDLLYLDGHDLRDLTLLRRKALLANILHDLPDVRLSEHVAEYGRAFFDAVAQRHLEGIIAKLGTSRYRSGQRSRSWLKIKTRLRQKAVIGGFTEQRGNRKNLGALVLGVYEGKDLVYVGHTGTGFSGQMLNDLRAKLEPLIQPKSPFKKRPKTNAPIHWVRPELVCEVSFSSWTEDGHVRHPVFLGLREDLPSLTVRAETSKAVGPARKETQGQTTISTAKPASKTRSSGGGLQIDGQMVHVTNLHKVYWPEEGYTKGDLIAYYREVASFILPYLRDRPQSLHRHPDGILEKSFFQKDISKQPPPDWVPTVAIPPESGKKVARGIVCQNEAALVYLSNLGCIELNPWNARLGTLEQPDYMLLDLDPEDIPFTRVVEVAQAIHQLLEQAGAESFCKTSGKRGLHVYVPFGARYSHNQAQDFAYLIAQIIHRRLPGLTSLARDPRHRHRRVYLDYLQNGKGKTLTAAYSVRPYPGATVSTPLKWAEVNKRLDPSKLTIRTLPHRLGRVGDLWQPVLGPGIDLQAILRRLSALLGKR